MSINLNWIGHRYRVIHAHVIDYWDWSDLHQALQKAQVLSSKSNYQTTLIFDFLGSTKASASNFALDTLPTPPSSPIHRFIIIIDEAPLAGNIAELLRGLYPDAEEILSVSCYEEAFSLVQ
jgi:hypothetical protein